MFGFKCFLSPSGVDEFPHLDRAQLAGRDGGDRVARLAAHRARRGPGAPRRAGRTRPRLRGVPRLPPARERGLRDRRGDRRGSAHRCPRAHPAPQRRAFAARDPGGQSGGHRADRRDVPALPDDRRRGDPRRGERVQVLPADPRGRRTATCSGRASSTARSTRSSATTRRRTVDLKRSGGGDFGLAWGGIAGLQVGLSAVWTEARGRGIPLETILPLFTTGPAAVAGLAGAGVIAPGAPAHLTVFGVDDPFVIDAARLLHKNPITAYDHRVLERQDPPHLAARQGDVQRDRGRRGRGARGSAASRAAGCCRRARPPRSDADGTRGRNPDAVGWGHADRRWRSCSRAAATSRATITCARHPRR